MNRSLRSDLAASATNVWTSRILRVAVFDATPETAREMRWSDGGPAVRAAQLLVAVDVESRGERVTGTSAATRYVPRGETAASARVSSAELHRYVGQDVISLEADRSLRENPYEASEGGVHVLVELAALDALGRVTRLPAPVLLGGACRTALPAYASLPSFDQPADAIAGAVAAASDGFGAVKFHASGDVQTDLETIGAARGELDSRVALIWDASCAYDLYGALAVGKALAAAGFLWFEAPMRDDAGAVLAMLARRLAIPLVPDASAGVRPIGEWGRDALQQVWGALRVDITRVRSVADAQRIVRLAEALGLPCEIQSFGYPLAQYANLCLMATTHSCHFFEAPYPATDLEDGLVAAPAIIDGSVAITHAPGLGHALDLDRLTTQGALIAHTGDL